jgi:hypothetical protein
MGCRFPRSDDPRDICFFAFRIGVHDYKQCDAYGMPSSLALNDAIGENNVQRVVPDPPCQLKRDLVLGEVGSCLFRIPFELHDAS